MMSSNVHNARRLAVEQNARDAAIQRASVDRYLAARKRRAAADEHNTNVKAAFERAKAGEVINLSELMASKEDLAS